MKQLVEHDLFGLFYVLGLLVLAVLFYQMNKRTEKKARDAHLVWQCAKCGCDVSPWAKKVKMSGGEAGGFYARVCRRCYRKNLWLELLAWGTIGSLFAFVIWLAYQEP
jgi:hypothetical protein